MNFDCLPEYSGLCKTAEKLSEERLSNKRYSHVMRVTAECDRLCGMFSELTGETEKERELFLDRLHISALLHDITKEFTYEEHISFCMENGYVLTNDDLNSPSVLHSITSSVTAEKLGAEKSICDAILYHTTARTDMKLMEKLLFIADYIEPGRKWESCIKEREKFYTFFKPKSSADDKMYLIDVTLLSMLDNTLNELVEEEKYIHSLTVSARNDLLKKKYDRQ